MSGTEGPDMCLKKTHNCTTESNVDCLSGGRGIEGVGNWGCISGEFKLYRQRIVWIRVIFLDGVGILDWGMGLLDWEWRCWIGGWRFWIEE